MKNKNGPISKTATLHAQHTFFVHFFAVVLHEQKLPTYTFYGGNVLRVLVHLFSLIFFTTAHFHLRGRKHVPFSHCRYKIFVFLPTKNVSLVFYLFRSFAR